MPSHIHPDATAPAAGYPDEPIATGPRRFHLGLIAHLEADQSPVLLRFNADDDDLALLQPGSTRLIGRGPNRPINTWQARSLGGADAVVTLEFTEEPQADLIIWHGNGAEGPAGPAGPQGIQGPAGPQGIQGPPGEPPAAALRARAIVGGNAFNLAGNASADFICDAVSLNVGAAYDPITGVFTCPIDQVGDYHVHATAATAGAALELELRISSDGGNNWIPIARSVQGSNGASLTDLVALNGGVMLKAIVTNATAGATSLLGPDGQLARSYLTITRVA